MLIILNPSISSFKNYAKQVDDPEGTLYKRKTNYLIFSVYSKEQAAGSEDHRQKVSDVFIGIAGNFFYWDEYVDSY